MVDAIRYRRRSGCAWRLLPHDFPHWRTVYGYDRQWRADGTWRLIERNLRELRTLVSGSVVAAAPSLHDLSLVNAPTNPR